ncbi:MAG: hypothetical protein ACSW8C_03755 [bacterium]
MMDAHTQGVGQNMKIQKFIALIGLAVTLALNGYGDNEDDLSEIEKKLAKLETENYTITFIGNKDDKCLLTKHREQISILTDRLRDISEKHNKILFTIKLEGIGFSNHEDFRCFLEGLQQIDNLRCIKGSVYIGRKAIISRTPQEIRSEDPETNPLRKNLKIFELQQ